MIVVSINLSVDIKEAIAALEILNLALLEHLSFKFELPALVHWKQTFVVIPILIGALFFVIEAVSPRQLKLLFPKKVTDVFAGFGVQHLVPTVMFCLLMNLSGTILTQKRVGSVDVIP